MAIYEYNATVDHISDPDTLTANVDLGYRLWLHGARFRIAGVSCRELKMTGGVEAKRFVEGLLPAGSKIRIRSGKVDRDLASDMSYDRYVAQVALPDGRDLAAVLLAAGWACRWDGRSKPTPYPDWPIV